jgi:hypothetical protein
MDEFHLAFVMLFRLCSSLEENIVRGGQRSKASKILTFLTKYPVPTSTMTLSGSDSLPGTYKELVNGTRMVLSAVTMR